MSSTEVDDAVYSVATVNLRGQVDEHDVDSREEAYALREQILAKHPDWTVRVRVWR